MIDIDTLTGWEPGREPLHPAPLPCLPPRGSNLCIAQSQLAKEQP